MPTYRYESKNSAGKMNQRRPQRRQPRRRLRRAPQPRGVHPRPGALLDSGRKKGGFSGRTALSFGPGPQRTSRRSPASSRHDPRRHQHPRRHRGHSSSRSPIPSFKQMLVQMKRDVESGKAVLRRHHAGYPKVFRPPLHQHGQGRRSSPAASLQRCSTASRSYLNQADRDLQHGQGRDDRPRHHRHHGPSAPPSSSSPSCSPAPSWSSSKARKRPCPRAHQAASSPLSAFMVDYLYVPDLGLVAAVWGFLLMIKTDWGPHLRLTR